MNKMVIAIDGPASSGKSTVANELAKKYGILHFNTGSMYRVFALYCLINKIEFNDEEKVIKLLDSCNIDVKFENMQQMDFLNGEYVTPYLRDELISQGSSIVSQYSAVRKKVLDTQRNIADKMSVVMEGRDITSEVLPNADFKFFVTASAEERANRRYKEISEKGIECNYETILTEVKERDKRDTTRKIAPLVLVKDATYIDTTNMTVEQVVQFIVNIIEKK